MKSLLRFLLNTEVGREITRMIIGAVLNLFKKKVLDKVEGYKRDNIKAVLDIAHEELHADLDAAKPTDLL
jgi:hypothetical protein